MNFLGIQWGKPAQSPTNEPTERSITPAAATSSPFGTGTTYEPAGEPSFLGQVFGASASKKQDATSSSASSWWDKARDTFASGAARAVDVLKDTTASIRNAASAVFDSAEAEALGDTLDAVTLQASSGWDRVTAAADEAHSFLNEWAEKTPRDLDDFALETFERTATNFRKTVAELGRTTRHGLEQVGDRLDDWGRTTRDFVDQLSEVAADTWEGSKRDVLQGVTDVSETLAEGYLQAEELYYDYAKPAVDLYAKFNEEVYDNTVLGVRSVGSGVLKTVALGGTLTEAAGELVRESGGFFDLPTAEYAHEVDNPVELIGMGVESFGQWVRTNANADAEVILPSPSEPWLERMRRRPGSTLIRTVGESIPGFLLGAGLVSKGAKVSMTSAAALGGSDAFIEGKGTDAISSRLRRGALVGGLSLGMHQVGARVSTMLDDLGVSVFRNPFLADGLSSSAEEAGVVLIESDGGWPEGSTSRVIEAGVTGGVGAASGSSLGDE